MLQINEHTVQYILNIAYRKKWLEKNTKKIFFQIIYIFWSVLALPTYCIITPSCSFTKFMFLVLFTCSKKVFYLHFCRYLVRVQCWEVFVLSPYSKTDLSHTILKGQSNKIFYLLFSLFKPAWTTDKWVKIFRISWSYLGEIDSHGYDTLGPGESWFGGFLTSRGMMLW